MEPPLTRLLRFYVDFGLSTVSAFKTSSYLKTIFSRENYFFLSVDGDEGSMAVLTRMNQAANFTMAEAMKR